jgi:DNA-binding transcriptional regulator YiaG
MACRPRPERTRLRRSAQDSLADRLYAWRKRNNYSQSEAAVKLQLSVRTLQEWEQGRAHPHALTARTLHQLTCS